MADSSSSSSFGIARLIGLCAAAALIAYGVEMRRHPPPAEHDPPWMEIVRTDSGVLLADSNGVDVADANHAMVFTKFERSTPVTIPGTSQRIAAVVGTRSMDCTQNTLEIFDAAALNTAGQPVVELDELKGHRDAIGSAAAPLCDYIRTHRAKSAERTTVDEWVRGEIARTGLDAIAIDTVACAENALSHGIVPVLGYSSAREERREDGTFAVPVVYFALGVARPLGHGSFSFDSAARFEHALFIVRAGAQGRPKIVCGEIPWNHVAAAEFDRYRDRLDEPSRAQWDSVYRHTSASVTLRHMAANH
jgi:hypothetical protein